MTIKQPLIQRGFTLVELLIVVIILAILAAIVVPQFASSTDDARESALDSNLANLRSAIDLYYQQHGEYPSASAASGGSCVSGGTASTELINTPAALVDQLAFYTNGAGQACSTQGAPAVLATYYEFGPYLKKAELPANPITNDPTLVISTGGDLNMAGDGSAGGWKFDNLSGKFIANDTDVSPSTGNSYDTR